MKKTTTEPAAAAWSDYLAPVPPEALAAELTGQGYRVSEPAKTPGRKSRCECGSCPLCKHRARNAAYRKTHKRGAEPNGKAQE